MGRRRGEREAPVDDGLLPEQHAPHVGMRDQRHGLPARLSERPTLRAVLRVEARLVVGGTRRRGAVHADADARLVHHLEHHAKPLMRRADEPAVAVVSVPEAEGEARQPLPADLVDDARDLHVVAHERAAFLPEPRHGKEADALGPRRRAVDARQHQVHHVLGDVVVGPADEDLGATNPVAAVLCRRGGARDVGERAPGLRLRERHGPGPLALVHLAEKALLHLVRAEGLDEVRRAGGQPGEAHHAQVAGHQVGMRQRRHRERELLPADLGGARRADGAELAHVPEGLAKARVELHAPAFEDRWLEVHGPERREEHLAAEAPAGAEVELEGLPAVVFEMGKRRERLGVEHVLEEELHQAVVEERVRHGASLRANPAAAEHAQLGRSRPPSGRSAKRPSGRGCTGSGLGQGQPPNWVRW